MTTDNRHVEILLDGTDSWNSWREQHPSDSVFLDSANLCGACLRDADLDGAKLRGANLNGARRVRNLARRLWMG